MGEAVLDKQRYSVRDYLSWDTDELWEIIDGQIVNMSPAPTVQHQRVSRKICAQLLQQDSALGDCELFIAPTDVIFDEYNVVQPDLFVVCGQEKITKKNIQGAPRLIIEIISPSTSSLDRREKKNIYERFGVKEYILVYPELRNIERFILVDGRYSRPEIYNWDEVLCFDSFEITLDLKQIFDIPETKPGKTPPKL